MGNNIQCGAKTTGSLPHAHQAVALALLPWIKALAIVRQRKMNRVFLDPELNPHIGAAGMPHHVMHALFEDEEHLAAYMSVQFYTTLRLLRIEAKFDVLRRQ